MRARGRFGAALVTVMVGSAALADAPKPKAVDISAYKDKLIVLTDAAGGTYAVYRDPTRESSQVFYGEGTTLYRQIVVGASSDGEAWDLATYSPRVSRSLRGSVMRAQDGTYKKFCADNEPDELTDLTLLGDEAAKKVIAKSKFVSSATLYTPYGFARDEKGVYYYVDQLSKEYGGKGYRLWVGKKGRMKQIALADVSDDSEGAVFSTKTGDLHFGIERAAGTEETSTEATWVRGEKTTKLKPLDPYNNTWLIHSELGIYKFMGTLCEDQRMPAAGWRLP